MKANAIDSDRLDCIFVSDLHGRKPHYKKLLHLISTEKPDLVFIGGDLLPGGSVYNSMTSGLSGDFINRFLIPEFMALKTRMAAKYPAIFIIMGNDDPRFEEVSLIAGAGQNLWQYCHNRRIIVGQYQVRGYAYIPPSPFQLKDWERYDVSRYVDVGSISPENGHYSIPVSDSERKWSTISKDLESLGEKSDFNNTIFLFHAPPYQTNLDRADLDDKTVDHVPLDVNIGSIAIRRFIEDKQPLISLHGHVHESTRITGKWSDTIGRTYLFSAAHDGPELAVVRFNPGAPESATRSLIRIDQ